MSRMLKVMIVLLAITAMVAPSVFAEDRLSLNGELRVRGWYKDNNTDFNDAGKASDSYFDQRLRIGGKVAVSEGVSANFRVDLWDGTWGESNNDLTDGDNRAWLVIDKDSWMVSAGKQYYGIGNAIAVDTNGTGFVFGLKNIGLELGYFQLDENATAIDDDETLATVALSHKTDMYSGTVFAGWKRSGGAQAVAASGTFYDVSAGDFDDDPAVFDEDNDLALTFDEGSDATNPSDIYLLGVAADFNLDAVKIKGEINYFDGEDDPITAGDATTDLKGLNIYLDGSIAASDMATVGAIFTYAKGYTGANEEQVTDLSDDGSFMPETYGYMATLFNIYPGASLNSTFDPTGDGLGTVSGQLYTTLKLTDTFSVRGSVFYTEPEEDYTAAMKADADENTTAYDSFVGGVLSSTYSIAQGAAIDTMLAYVSTDAATPETADDEAVIGGFRLRVRF